MKLPPRTAVTVTLLMGLSAGLLAFQAGGFQRRFMPSQTYEPSGVYCSRDHANSCFESPLASYV